MTELGVVFDIWQLGKASLLRDIEARKLVRRVSGKVLERERRCEKH